jgi:hypothetical protein
MKRIILFLARLYPGAWRSRYGAEYEALLEDRSLHVADVFDVLWGAVTMQMTSGSSVRIVVPSIVLGVIAAVAVAFTLPARYEA